ncbi:MAG: hypothetical protein EOO50_16990 [Flavobacterium sp.]|uniref:M48 family metallopeptidase n=1 Tax=Flavobacterium sp. TaxID=239 RepID=UPI001218F280|nr:M48 family metallopeptidase [Flavobacterium sp.]RZJ63335.1 MAG: hypothetical protein EOO50_16990 [Flavobacterium sp.]
MHNVTVSANFKKRAWRAVFSILLFIATYLLLFALALAICAGFGFAAIALFMFKATAITVMLGLALLACGLAIVFFMVKFAFAKNRSDYSGLTEIDVSKEPKLEAAIRRLTTEIGTPFPKKIFLSHEVNASVFYDSGFWSMFLPVSKNLHIGMGLVNATTVSEFRGIMAH